MLGFGVDLCVCVCAGHLVGWQQMLGVAGSAGMQCASSHQPTFAQDLHMQQGSSRNFVGVSACVD
jgi:hypothetical protein